MPCRPPLQTALLTALLATLLVALGCAAAQAPDEALAAELRPAVETTLAAMAVPETERPGARDLDGQLQLLSCRVTPAHAAAIRAGTHGRTALIAEWRELLRRRAVLERTQEPPRMLLWLVAHEPWTTGQALLVEALLRQYESEAALTAPEPELAR